jgi:hypothetical protein
MRRISRGFLNFPRRCAVYHSPSDHQALLAAAFAQVFRVPFDPDPDALYLKKRTNGNCLGPVECPAGFRMNARLTFIWRV